MKQKNVPGTRDASRLEPLLLLLLPPLLLLPMLMMVVEMVVGCWRLSFGGRKEEVGGTKEKERQRDELKNQQVT